MTVRPGPRCRCRAGLVATGDSGQPAPARLRTWLQAVVLAMLCVGGSGCRGAALVPDDGDRLPLGEPGAGGERLIEPAVA